MKQLPVDGEHIRLRDEWGGSGNRIVVRDRDDGQPGVAVVVAAGDHVYLVGDPPPCGVEILISTLTRLLKRNRIATCPWCDTLGLVDGDGGLDFCTHLPGCDAG